MNRVASSSIRAFPRQWNRMVGQNSGAIAFYARSAFSTIPQEDLVPPSLSSIRTSILKSALQEVHQLGWTEDALAAATASVRENKKISMSVVGMMTVDDLIAFCMDQWNVQLKEDLLPTKSDDGQSTKNSNVDPLEHGIKTRLEYLVPYLQSNRWHEGMAIGIRGPSNALQTQRQLQEMVEVIVQSSPEHRSLGTSERMALGAVYVATELRLLTDTSPGYRDTWAFLSQRMDDWRRLTSLGGGKAGDAVFVASSVASSLMGGLVSLVMTPGGGVFGLSQQVISSLFQNPQASWGENDRQAGTHPDDYRVNKQSPATTADSKK